MSEASQSSDKITILDSIQLSHSKIELRSDGIVVLSTISDFMFSLKETVEGIDAIGKLSGGNLVAVMKIAGLGSSVDTDSRHYIASGRGSRYSIAEAIVIQSIAQKIIGNFYLKVEKPIKPTKLFTDRSSAELWLYEQMFLSSQK
ncbi:MAG: hypothetical protein IPP32_14995 [Bacteroidetes bacterium]|nr:hypothetical protein [Bacteroidota bacterium]